MTYKSAQDPVYDRPAQPAPASPDFSSFLAMLQQMFNTPQAKAQLLGNLRPALGNSTAAGLPLALLLAAPEAAMKLLNIPGRGQAGAAGQGDVQGTLNLQGELDVPQQASPQGGGFWSGLKNTAKGIGQGLWADRGKIGIGTGTAVGANALARWAGVPMMRGMASAFSLPSVLPATGWGGLATGAGLRTLGSNIASRVPAVWGGLATARSIGSLGEMGYDYLRHGNLQNWQKGVTDIANQSEQFRKNPSAMGLVNVVGSGLDMPRTVAAARQAGQGFQQANEAIGQQEAKMQRMQTQQPMPMGEMLGSGQTRYETVAKPTPTPAPSRSTGDWWRLFKG